MFVSVFREGLPLKISLLFLCFATLACTPKQGKEPAFQEGRLLEWGPDVLSQPYEIFSPQDKSLKKMSVIEPEARDYHFVVNLSGIIYVGSVSEAVGKEQIGWWENGETVQVKTQDRKMWIQNPRVKTLETKIISRIPPEPSPSPPRP